MTAILTETLLPDIARSRCTLHYRRHGGAVRLFRRAIQRQFVLEVERMCGDFMEGPLREQAAAVVSALREYVSWLGWCALCSAHLAPPLGLSGLNDARRMAAALLVYSGPRLADDAIDNHRSYKGIRRTLLDRLLEAFPDREPAVVRCNVVLLGAWLALYGTRRLASRVSAEAAQRSLRLCERIAPAGIVESLQPCPVTWEQYRQIVLMKAVCYDQILYGNLLEPLQDELRSRLLAISSRISRLAQYLNDLCDRERDAAEGQNNIVQWLRSDEEIGNFCRLEAKQIVAALESVPAEAGDAFSAALVETVESAARMQLHADERAGSTAS